jgi:hypothetical protein
LILGLQNLAPRILDAILQAAVVTDLDHVAEIALVAVRICLIVGSHLPMRELHVVEGAVEAHGRGDCGSFALTREVNDRLERLRIRDL